MNRDLRSLAGGNFDLLIIGGGIFGAATARDAALRGLRVALIEKADFASGTSSRSSKLIHGGFRYLEQLAFGLVAEACRERRILQRIAPQLVRPQPFLLPVYENDPRSLAKIRLGMTLYDLLAFYFNIAPHRLLSPEHALRKEPALRRHGLRAAALFYDCCTDDARLCLSTLLDAAEHGAVCANYCELTGFLTRNDRILAARLTDRLGGGSFEVSARLFVNAAGPWVEQIAALTPFNSHRVALSPTKGVHLLLPRLTQTHAIAFQARRDGRILFLIPWGDCSILGTTDTDFRDPPDNPRAEPGDVEYLLGELRTLMPELSVADSDIITTFAGVRALLRAEHRPPWQRRREHRIIRHGQNLLSIAGGKYTTARLIAEQTVNAACEMLGRRPPRCRTATTALPDRRPPPSGERISDSPPVHASDIVHACEHEMAVTVSDVMRRRTPLALSRHGGPEPAARVALHMARCLRWTDAQMYDSLHRYLAEWKASRP